MACSYRTCTDCQRTRPIESFYADPRYKGGRTRICKVCINFRNSRNDRLNPDAARERQARYHERHPGASAATTAAYRARNPERVRNSRTESYYRDLEASRRAVRARMGVRRDRVREAGGSYSKADVAEILALQQERCFYCLGAIRDGEFQVDHAIPVARGGSSDRSNIVLACASCNGRKYTKTAAEFLRILKNERGAA